MRHILFLIVFLFIISCFVQLHAQIKLVPLSHNSALMKEKPSNELRSDHYSGKSTLHIQAGRVDSFCIDFLIIDNAFDTMEILRPVIPAGGVASINEECLIYEADDLPFRVTDSFELKVLDVDSFEYYFLVVINVVPSRDLPFIDDFSYRSHFPDSSLWLDKYAFVNFTWGKDPPSIGVASLDGVDEKGRPYGGGTGISDHLTSTFLNLEGVSDPVFEFYYQARGNGFRDNPREEDSLIVEFRQADGKWVKAISFPGIEGDPTPEFKFIQIELADSLTYDGFQFRFKNISRRDGILGTWHLDYIQVRDRAISTERYPDVALRELPTSLFKRYTAIPSTHFKDHFESFIADSNWISIGNYFPSLQVIDDSRVLISEKRSGTPILERSDEENLLKSSATSGDGKNQIDLGPGTYEFRNALRTRNTILQRVESMNIQEDDSLNFEMTYTFENNERSPAFERNNTVSRDNRVNDYYAYDDGTAEMGFQSKNYLTAIQFTSTVDDSLKGVRIFFPYVYNEGNRKRFKLLIWGSDLDEEPIYEKIYDSPIFPDRSRNPGAFTTLALTDQNDESIALEIPRGDFYIGWEQISPTGYFYVGFDRNNPDARQYNYFHDGFEWKINPHHGAVMIRPVFGPHEQWTTDVRNKEKLEALTLYPNPASKNLYLAGEFQASEHIIQITDMQGREMKRIPYSEELSITELPAGMYIIRISDEQNQLEAIQKFIKQ